MAKPVNVANSRVQLSCSSDLLMAARRVLGVMMMMALNFPPSLDESFNTPRISLKFRVSFEFDLSKNRGIHEGIAGIRCGIQSYNETV